MSNDILALFVMFNKYWPMDMNLSAPMLTSRTLYRVAILTWVLAWAISAQSNAAIDDARAAALSANLEALSSGENIPLARDTVQLLADPEVTEADWGGYFTSFFHARPYTQPLNEFFAFALNDSPLPLIQRIAFTAATAAAASAGPMLANLADTAQPGDPGGLFYALATMQQALPALGDQGRGSAFSLMTSQVQGKAMDLTAFLQPGPGGDAFNARLGMMVCITLSSYAGPGPQQGQATNLMRLPDRMRTFWLNTGVFLFDNGALSDAQVVSLDSLLRSFTPNLHDIVALIAFQAYGLDPAASGLMTPRQLVPVPAISADALTLPMEFAARVPSPEVPDFTATAAVNVFRAVQEVQFARRPELVVRRDAILARSGLRDVSYLRRTVAPDLYMAQPFEFLPQTAYLWFINSEVAFRMALDFFRLRQQAPMESLLLIADVLSSGSDVTLTFSISPTGIVASAPTQIGRALVEGPLDSGLPPTSQTNSIVMMGQPWDFTMGPSGNLVSLIHEGGAFAL